MYSRFYLTLLFISGLILFAFMIFAGYKEITPEWKQYQTEYREILVKNAKDKAAKEKARSLVIGHQQIYLGSLKRVDRCMNCHIGVENPLMAEAKIPFRQHSGDYLENHPLSKFGCTVCHDGQGRAPNKEEAHGPTESWSRAIYHENFMQNSCSKCHGDFIRDEAPVLYRGREIFYAYGCRGCHKVKGKERVKVGPPINKIGQKVKIDWLYRWIKDPKEYLPQTKMPNFRLSDQEAADITRFLIPRIKSREIQSTGGSYERGKNIFGESRCITCHLVEGRGGNIGPDLAKISSKTYPDYLYQWIKNPKKMLPNTLMPIYGFSDQEIRDLVTFLTEEYIDLELEEEQVAQDLKHVETGDAQNGKDLIEEYGCAGCHEIEGVVDRGEIGLDLTTIGVSHITRLDFGEIKVPEEEYTVPNWLYNKVKNPRLFKDGLKMPDFGFSNTEVEAVTTYLLSLTAEEVPASYQLLLGESPSEYNPQGEFGKIMEKYLCLVCHKINGRGGDMAPDLSQEGSRVRKEWLRRFMRTPYAIRPILVERMLRYKILDSEIETLYSYFRTTLVDDRVERLSSAVKEMALDDPMVIRRGRKLYYEKYACNACHQINLKGGTIGPDLTEAGERLRTEWILYYLRDPKAFLKRSVEPIFKLTDREIEALTAFLINPKEKE